LPIWACGDNHQFSRARATAEQVGQFPVGGGDDPTGVERLKQGFKPVVVGVDAPHVCGCSVPGSGDPFQLGLCLVNEVVNVAVTGVADLRDASPSLDQAAQRRTVSHDPGVIGGLAAEGGALYQRVQVGGATHSVQQSASAEPVHHCDRSDRGAAVIQIQQRVVDELVGRAVEIGGGDDPDDVAQVV